MNKIVVFFILTTVTLSLIATVYGQAFSVVLEERKGHKNQCYYKPEGKKTKYFDAGKTVYENKQCLQLSCTKINGLLYFDSVGCGLVAELPNCKIVRDKKKRHPDCCPVNKCS